MALTVNASGGNALPDYGSRPALMISIGVHVGLVIVALWLARPQPPQPELPAVRVQLASMPNGGKRKVVKAPVAGRQRQPPKAQPVEKAEAKVVPQQPAPKDLGLKQTKKQEKPKAADKTPKPKPEPSKPQVSRNTRPEPAEPRPPPKEPENLKIPIATGGGGGSGTPGLAMELGEADPNIDLKDGEFNTYFQVIYEKIYQRWSRGGLTSGKTKIQFRIHRNGSISDIKVLESSGKPYLDAPAQRAVQGAEFPPLPQGYLGSALIVNIMFQYD